jgi:HEAT repeat protein
VVIFIVALTHGQLARVGVRTRAPVVPVASAGVTIAANVPAPAVTHASVNVDDPTIPEERRLAVVEEMERDSRDAATDVLLAAADSPSVVVAMASVRALRGRPCTRVGSLLVGRLADREWQRRAWAAKVLGENGCVAAAPELRRRLRNERDPRVRAQVATALATLARGTPG